MHHPGVGMLSAEVKLARSLNIHHKQHVLQHCPLYNYCCCEIL